MKTRLHGNTGDMALNYDKDIRRFTQYGGVYKKYSWLKGMEHWETVDGVLEM